LVGLAVGSAGLGDAATDGVGEAGAVSGTASSSVWWTPSFEIHMSVAGTSSMAGVTAIARTSAQSGALPAGRYWAT